MGDNWIESNHTFFSAILHKKDWKKSSDSPLRKLLPFKLINWKGLLRGDLESQEGKFKQLVTEGVYSTDSMKKEIEAKYKPLGSVSYTMPNDYIHTKIHTFKCSHFFIRSSRPSILYPSPCLVPSSVTSSQVLSFPVTIFLHMYISSPTFLLIMYSWLQQVSTKLPAAKILPYPPWFPHRVPPPTLLKSQLSPFLVPIAFWKFPNIFFYACSSLLQHC